MIFSEKNCFSQKCSYGQAECSSDNPAEKCSTEGQKLFPQSPKLFIQLYFYSQKKLFLPHIVPLDYSNFLKNAIEKEIFLKI